MGVPALHVGLIIPLFWPYVFLLGCQRSEDFYLPTPVANLNVFITEFPIENVWLPFAQLLLGPLYI